MATTRAAGFDVDESIWNNVLSKLNDAGTIFSGIVDGETGTFTPSLQVTGAPDNGGFFVVATTTNRPIVSLQNATTGVLSTIQGTNDKGMVFWTNGLAKQVLKLNANGQVDVGVVFDGININATGGINAITLYPGARGSGAVTGNVVSIGHNTSGSGAAGFVFLESKDGTGNAVWPDVLGQLRIGPLAPTADGSNSDTGGTIVGSQTSTIDAKDILGEGIPPHAALALILSTPVHRFRYKGGTYNGTEFHGIVAEESPAFAMDPDDTHPHGRSFNPVSASGITIQAIKAMSERLTALEARVAELEAAR